MTEKIEMRSGIDGARIAQGTRQEPMNTSRSLNLLQGETRFSDDPDLMMTTLLGSCVATCMWDEAAGVGGMNHFLLPGDLGGSSANLGYGVNAMEILVNGLLKMGARREHLKVKLFGGAKMNDGNWQIGRKNSEFALWFMEQEKLPVVMQCLGGQRGRKIRFWPATGKAQRMFMEEARATPEARARPTSLARPEDGDVELF